MHITPESRLHFQTICFLLHRLYRYEIPNLTVSVIATDFQGSQRIYFFFFLVKKGKECVCKPLSQFISWIPELFP